MCSLQCSPAGVTQAQGRASLLYCPGTQGEVDQHLPSLGSASVRNHHLWQPLAPAARSCSLGKGAEMPRPSRNVLWQSPARGPGVCSTARSPFHGHTFPSQWAGARPEFKLCTKATCPGSEHRAPSCRGCSSLPWGCEPNRSLHKPTDGCLAFLSINSHFCCRGTTVSVLWNLISRQDSTGFCKKKEEESL